MATAGVEGSGRALGGVGGGGRNERDLHLVLVCLLITRYATSDLGIGKEDGNDFI